MFRNKPTVDWEILGEEEQNRPWPPAPPGQDSHSKPGIHQRLRRAVLFGVTLAILLVIGLGVTYARLAALQGVQALEQDVQTTVEVEEWVRKNTPGSVADTLVDDGANSKWQDNFRREFAHTAGEQVEIGDISVRSGLAMVEVTVEEIDGTRHREARFYREDSNSGWLRTSPSVVFWGAEQTVETTHFRIHFRQKDAQAAEGVALRLDRVYTLLRQDAGLLPDADKLTVEVTPSLCYQLGCPRYVDPGARNLAVPSPLLLRAPAELSDEEILTQSIVYLLVLHVLNEAQQQAPIRPEWRTMLKGLQLWQAYAGADSFHPTYQHVVAWLYHDVSALRAGHQTATREDLIRLCRDFAIWQDALPLHLVHPRLCINPDQALHLAIMTDGAVQLTQFIDSAEPELMLLGQWNEEWVRGVGAATVVDYLVATYGRERLRNLLAGLRTFDSWDALVPVVFGVSAQEFERGWTSYVADLGSRSPE